MSKSNEPCIVHLNDGERHTVAAQLRVLICPAEVGFVAQGLEIDYCATGATIEQVQERFADGLLRTAVAMVKRGRSLAGLMKTQTPLEAWEEYVKAESKHTLACAEVFEYRGELPAGMPFRSLAFCKSSEAHALA